jgi:hypothetical protein
MMAEKCQVCHHPARRKGSIHVDAQIVTRVNVAKMAYFLALVLFVVLNAPLFAAAATRKIGFAGLNRWTMQAIYEKMV